MSVNLRCPNCGASASLPLGMSCSDHRPVIVCSTCGGRGLVPATGRGADGYEPCPDCDPEPTDRRVPPPHKALGGPR